MAKVQCSTEKYCLVQLNNCIRTLFFLCLIATGLLPSHAQESVPDTSSALVGDLGFGANHSPTPARSSTSDNRPIPYINVEYGRFFGRIDTFGFDLVPVGYGALELVTRSIDDGYAPATTHGNLEQRRSSVPIGLGTMQTTPLGAVLFNVYHDVGQSQGNLADLLFAEELDTDYVAFYPQIGAEYRSGNYVAYYYGLTPLQAAQVHLNSYRPGSATNLFIDLFAEVKITGNWFVNFNFHKTWFDQSITASPLVNHHVTTAGFLALSYRFE